MNSSASGPASAHPTQRPLRIAPLEEDQIPPGLLAAMDAWRVNGQLFNLFPTYAKNVKMAESWARWGAYVFAKTALSPRHTEMLILRTTWLCRSLYEFTHHTMVGAQRGLTDDEIEQIALQGSAGDEWDPLDRLVLAAAEEIEANASVGDTTWAALADHLTEPALMDLVMTCGTYRIGSIMTNSLGIQLEVGLPVSPQLVPVIAQLSEAS